MEKSFDEQLTETWVRIFDTVKDRPSTAPTKDKWVPKYGEEVEVSDDRHKWGKRIYLGYHEGMRYPHCCVDNADENAFRLAGRFNSAYYTYIRKAPPTIEVTKEEIARLKGVKPDQIKIVD